VSRPMGPGAEDEPITVSMLILAAALKALGPSTPIARVRRVCIRAEPDETVFDKVWGDAVRQLRAIGLLIEDSTANTWSPGPLIDKALITTGWPEERVRVAIGRGQVEDFQEPAAVDQTGATCTRSRDRGRGGKR